MVAAHEQAVVAQRDLHVGQHQARVHAARAVEHRVGLEQRFEQQADEVDRVVLVRAQSRLVRIQAEAARAFGQLARGWRRPGEPAPASARFERLPGRRAAAAR
jgi:uncharacterized protein with FMN-binding domain